MEGGDPLRTVEGQAALRALLAEADVLVENFKPGTLEGWGLGWDALHALNPRLIMLRVSGYGQTGLYAGKPGFGVLGEAMGGLRHLTAKPGRVPVRVGVSIGDTLAALQGVISVLMALRHREVHGDQGQMIDVALYESVLNVMEGLLPEYDAFGAVRGARRSGQCAARHRAQAGPDAGSPAHPRTASWATQRRDAGSAWLACSRRLSFAQDPHQLRHPRAGRRALGTHVQRGQHGGGDGFVGAGILCHGLVVAQILLRVADREAQA